MSQYDDDDDFDTDGSAIGDIRKALRSAEKRNKALEQELTSFRQESRKRELAASIEARGLNPKIAGLIPQDADPAAWIEEFGELFSAPPAAQDAQADEPPAIPAPEGASTFSEVATTGATPIGDEGQLMALITGAKTKADLDRLIFGHAL